MATILSIVIGGLITITTAMVVEYLRLPKLDLVIENPPLDREMEDPKRACRNLRLILRNMSLPWLLRFIQRSAALQCRGEISFHNLDDGQPVFVRTMPVRWVRSPEPIANQIVDTSGKVQFVIHDYTRVSTDSRIDVYPGEEEMLDVAVRFAGEPNCFGWNNEAYLHNWRNPNFLLMPGRYIAKVTITSSGRKCIGKFRLINNVEALKDFRLTELLPEDRKKRV
jgi:hypothetical protein